MIHLLRLSLLLAALTLGLLGPAPCLRAQDAAPEFNRWYLRYQEASRNHSPENIRSLDAIIRGCGDVVFGRDRETRERAERVLRSIVTQGGADAIYRLRVAALQTLGRVARTPATVRFLLELPTKRDREVEAISYWAIQAIARLEHPSILVPLVREGLTHPRPEVRLVVLRGLRGLKSEAACEMVRGMAPLVLRALEARRPELRAAAVSLAGRLRLEGAAARVVAQVKSSDALLRLATADALGFLAGEPGTWKPLLALLEDPDARVREEAVLAMRRAGDVRGVPHLILRLRKEPLRVRTAIYETLEQLTERELDHVPETWEAWWREKGPGLLAAAASARAGKAAPPSDPRHARRQARGRYAVTYYGIPVLSDRIVFVIDISGSMEWGGDESDGLRRIDLAKRELLKTVSGLDRTTRFNVVAFSGSNTFFQPKGLFRATAENKRKVERWVGNLAPRGGTNTHGVLEAVFERFPEADTCYLLTDGSPTLGKVVVQEKIVALVDRWNQRRRLRIHTITLLKGDAPNAALAALDDKDDAARFMKRLAALTRATYVRKED